LTDEPAPLILPDDIAKEGKPDPGKPRLKGGGFQIVKFGDMDSANQDFDRLVVHGIEVRRGGVRVGTLSDGRRIIARPFSEPTLEIQTDGKPDLKIRYRK
jgi:hypothetical protein